MSSRRNSRTVKSPLRRSDRNNQPGEGLPPHKTLYDMSHIKIYTSDYTRISDDFHFGYGSFFTNRKAAQRDCDHMNSLSDEDGNDDKTWRYIVHEHTAFSW